MAKGYQSERTGADVDRLLDKIDEFNPATKVDKVSGKQLSTEDFTTALKQKLQGLENYDDTEIINAIDRLRRDFDTLISGDTSEAIDTFNDIVAFLEGIEESENLDNIIAAIQLQIAGKQDKINDLDTIRAGAAKGATALQQHQDISHLATKDEVTQGLGKKVNEEQFGELYFAKVDGLDNGEKAYALPDSANGDEDDVLLSRDTSKTVNGKSIYGKGNIYIPEYDDTHLDLRVSNLEQNKADKNGVYPEMSVGLAEYLGSRPFFEDAEFVFRASAGEENSIKDGLASIQSIKGNSVVWNQQNQDPYFQRADEWTSTKITLSISDGVLYGEVTNADSAALYALHISNIPNHYYAYIIDYKASEGTCYIYSGGKGYSLGKNSGNRETRSIVFESGATFVQLGMYPNLSAPVGSTFEVYGIRLYDLTQMFGASNEPTTIEEFYARIPSGVDMNAYNAGEVIHMNTESIKSVGDNAWDEEWENGTFNTTTGENITEDYVADQIRSKNFIPILPNEEYYVCQPPKLGVDGMWALLYDADKNVIEGFDGTEEKKGNSFKISIYSDNIFTTAPNARYMRFYMPKSYGNTYNHDIMISIVHSGWKQDVDAGYQPYWEDNLDLSVIGKYFPQGMKKAGSAHDEIRFNKASGKWEAVQRIGGVDMGTMTWGIDSFGLAYTHSTIHAIVDSSGHSRNVICSHLGVKQESYWEATTNDVVMLAEYGKIFITGNILTDTTPAELQDKLKGIILYYELAEPIITEIEEDLELFYDAADFGTEEAASSVPSAPFRAKMSYDFNANDSIRNNSVSIRELKKIIAELTNRINSLESNQQ